MMFRGSEVVLAIDAAASEFHKNGKYMIGEKGALSSPRLDDGDVYRAFLLAAAAQPELFIKIIHRCQREKRGKWKKVETYS